MKEKQYARKEKEKGRGRWFRIKKPPTNRSFCAIIHGFCVVRRDAQLPSPEWTISFEDERQGFVYPSSICKVEQSFQTVDGPLNVRDHFV